MKAAGRHKVRLSRVGCPIKKQRRARVVIVSLRIQPCLVLRAVTTYSREVSARSTTSAGTGKLAKGTLELLAAASQKTLEGKQHFSHLPLHETLRNKCTARAQEANIRKT
mmetsp:Transcript_85375/g.178397  ORF Transcript_85375/g.178397 Transcript_85375/m.178397 type:complete len:110 (-) Transcript_85375:17-346(-)